MQIVYTIVGLLFVLALSLLIIRFAIEGIVEIFKHSSYNERVSRLRGRLYNHIRWSGYEFPIIEYAFEEAAKSLDYQSTAFNDSSAFRETLRKRFGHLIRAEEIHQSMTDLKKPSAPPLSPSEAAKVADMESRAQSEPGSVVGEQPES